MADGITIGEFAPVLEDAKLPCALGGNISIVLTPAAAFAMVPKGAKKEKAFWEKSLDFGMGLGEGLWTGAKGTVTGVCDLAMWVGKHSTPYLLLNPSGYAEQLQQDAATMKALGSLAADAGSWAYRNSAVNMLTNPKDYIAMQQENAVMAGKVVEKAKQMDAKDWGNLTGQVGFEIITEVATAGAGAVVTGMKAADRTVDVARAADKIDDIADATKAADASDAARATDKVEDVADAAGPEKLGDVVYGGDKAVEVDVKVTDELLGKQPEGAMLHSSDELMGVEKASEELIEAISKKRRVIIAQEGSEELRMLDYFGAEASVGGEDMASIILRKNPSKAAILEEFLHGTQHNLDIIDELGRPGAEAHVKDFMIRHQKILGLGDEDVEILKPHVTQSYPKLAEKR